MASSNRSQIPPYTRTVRMFIFSPSSQSIMSFRCLIWPPIVVALFILASTTPSLSLSSLSPTQCSLVDCCHMCKQSLLLILVSFDLNDDWSSPSHPNRLLLCRSLLLLRSSFRLLFLTSSHSFVSFSPESHDISVDAQTVSLTCLPHKRTHTDKRTQVPDAATVVTRLRNNQIFVLFVVACICVWPLFHSDVFNACGFDKNINLVSVNIIIVMTMN